MTNTHHHETIWETYAAAWKAVGAAAKQELLQKSVTDDCVYTDPLAEAHGHAALIDYMLQFHEQVPGGHFVTTYFRTHHDRTIARWNMVGPDGTVLGDGVSYGELKGNKLTAMTGFFDPPAP